MVAYLEVWDGPDTTKLVRRIAADELPNIDLQSERTLFSHCTTGASIVITAALFAFHRGLSGWAAYNGHHQAKSKKQQHAPGFPRATWLGTF